MSTKERERPRFVMKCWWSCPSQYSAITTMLLLPTCRSLPRISITKRHFFSLLRGGNFRDISKERGSFVDTLWDKYPLSVCAIQGERPTMEDEFLTANDCIAVFDGHGGNAVAQYLRFNLCAHLQAARAVASENDANETLHPAEILRNTLLKVDEEVQKIKHWSFQGSTAVVIWMPTDDTLVIANVGDSRAVLSRKSTSIDLTVDHKPNHPKERARIEAAGGFVAWDGPDEFNGVYRMNGNMALSRAIGDSAERPVAIADPDVEVWRIQETDEFVVVATDGLWDVLTSQDVVSFVHMLLEEGDETFDRDAIPALLVEEALRRHSFDNIAVIILWLR